MKLIIKIILTGVAMMPFFQSATLAVSTIDPTLSNKIERSPQYKDGKFVGNLNALNMSLADYASTTWDFLFTRNARTPDTELPFKPVDLTHFNIPDNGQLNVTWVIMTPFHKLFFSGDSGYFDGFKKIGDKYGPFDMTFIECGAYNKSREQVHMFPEQTVQAHLDLKGIILHPIHWATFNLALHSWYDPMMRLTAAAESKNVKYATPVVGETTLYGKTIPATKWWEQAVELHSSSTERIK